MSKNTYAYLILLIAAVITFALRLSAFLFFSKRTMPKSIKYIANILPLAIIPMLIIYCVRQCSFTDYKSFIPTIVGIAITAIVHIFKKNTILSLIVGTLTYMILIRIL